MINPIKSRSSLLALALLVPAPTAGVLAGMVLWPGTAAGRAVYTAAKIWLLALPLIWHMLVERRPLRLPRPGGGIGAGLISGLVMGAVVLAASLWLAPRMLDLSVLRDNVAAVGLDRRTPYILGAIYWTVVNALLEEYVWRWFCVSRCRRLLPAVSAVFAAALFFTVHHLLALLTLMPAAAALLCTAGVFTAGLYWSALYLRHGSIIPPYISHIIVDAAVFAAGYRLLFQYPE